MRPQRPVVEAGNATPEGLNLRSILWLTNCYGLEKNFKHLDMLIDPGTCLSNEDINLHLTGTCEDIILVLLKTCTNVVINKWRKGRKIS